MSFVQGIPQNSPKFSSKCLDKVACVCFVMGVALLDALGVIKTSAGCASNASREVGNHWLIICNSWVEIRGEVWQNHTMFADFHMSRPTQSTLGKNSKTISSRLGSKFERYNYSILRATGTLVGTKQRWYDSMIWLHLLSESIWQYSTRTCLFCLALRPSHFLQGVT